MRWGRQKREPVTVRREITILNKFGMHARPAAEFARRANSFRSEISVIVNGERFAATSLIDIMRASLGLGAKATIEAHGTDAEEAVEAMTKTSRGVPGSGSRQLSDFKETAVPSEKSTFRVGFVAGLLSALALGVYLFLLWSAANQVELHTTHLLTALEKNDWSEVGEFLDPSYADQWGHDRETLLTRLRQVLPYARHLRLHPAEVRIVATGNEGEWRGRVNLEADPNELSTIIRERINSLEEPFTLQWRQVSWKPWDWRLVRVTNPALEISESAF